MDPRYSQRQQSYGTNTSQGFGQTEFNVAEFYRICETVTTNIFTISGKIRQLEDIGRALGTQRDNQGIRDKVHVMQKAANQIITQTTIELKRLNDIVPRSDRQRKLQVERMTGDFQITVQRYSDIQNKMASKMKSHVIPHSDTGAEEDSGTYDSESAHLLAAERWHQQQKQLHEAEFEHGMLEERAQRVQQIERDILDVNSIMQQLGDMVHEQGAVVDTIEHNIEHAHGGVESGVEHLHKASVLQRKYRKKLCFLFVIAAIVATVLVIVLVTQLKR